MVSPDDASSDRFVRDVLSNRNNAAILDRWSRLPVAGGWLVAGCLFQTVWNLRSDLVPEASIKDYDLFYFDAGAGEDDERRVQALVETELADLGIVVEATNQARVHLWYEDHFGHPYPELVSAEDGIDRFLVLSTCVAIRPRAASFEVYAPYGLQPLYDGVLKPNPLCDHRPLFERKARSYAERWPWLCIDTA